jgi:thiamine kinase-like enzyme
MPLWKVGFWNGEFWNGQFWSAWLRRQRPHTRAVHRLPLFGQWTVLTFSLPPAICMARSCGVLHRDLKLENLMLTKHDSSLRVIDFGLAHQYAMQEDGKTPKVSIARLCVGGRVVEMGR